MPDGSMELVINLAEDRLATYDASNPTQSETHGGCLLVGARSEHFVIDTQAQTSVMGIHFKPGGAFPFLGCPSNEVQNQNISLELLWGQKAADLREQVLEAETPQRRFQVLEQLMLEMLAGPGEPSPAVRGGLIYIQQAEPTTPMAQIAEQVGYSSRRFIQLFKQEVGLTPKLFSRINRFQRVLSTLEEVNVPDWSRVATDNGFTDQAHFNHDFRSFSGLTPSSFVHQRGERRNHVPL